MSHYGIRPVDRSCASYGPGHQVHWIQAKKSAENPQVGDPRVGRGPRRRALDLEGNELKLTMWNHDPGRLRDAVHYRGRGVWKPRFDVLAVPGPSGYLFNLAALDERTPCHPGTRQAPGESTPDFLARAVREDHGFTVPGQIFFVADAYPVLTPTLARGPSASTLICRCDRDNSAVLASELRV